MVSNMLDISCVRTQSFIHYNTYSYVRVPLTMRISNLQDFLPAAICNLQPLHPTDTEPDIPTCIYTPSSRPPSLPPGSNHYDPSSYDSVKHFGDVKAADSKDQ